MRITGQQSIADVFGVTRESIDTWQNQGMPVEVRGGPGVPSIYDSAVCIAWR
jgi:phage terminase Nu1 subunit (DNA packaging protein)